MALCMRHVREAVLIWADTATSAASVLDYAVVVANPHEGEGDVVGYADRYGGMGLINNGGAGRGAFYKGRYLKGVGRTPLIGSGQRDWHSDGLLFVEEAARECIFGSLAALEAPWGGVRPIAVIDIGAKDDLRYRDSATNINRTLVVVREPTLRAAHLERALLYRGEETFGGMADEGRVAANISRMVSLLGSEGALKCYVRLWYRWAEQCGYHFVHRLPQSSPSTSNVAIDGRLIDFGGSRSLPDWSFHMTGAGLAPFGTEIDEIVRFLHSGGMDVIRRLSATEDPVALATFVEKECRRRYARVVVSEVMRLVGFRRTVVDRHLASAKLYGEFEQVVGTLIGRRRSRYPYEPDWSDGEVRWLLPRFWDRIPPRPLRRLRELSDAIVDHDEPMADRTRLRTRSRPELSFAALSARVYEELNPHAEGASYAGPFRKLVANAVTANRRDSAIEPQRGVPVGFIHTGYQSLALFRTPTGTMEAYEEFSTPRICGAPKVGLSVLDLSTEHVTLADGRTLAIQAAELEG